MITIENATITALYGGYEVRPIEGYVLYDLAFSEDEYQIYSYVIFVPNAERLNDIIAVPIEEVPDDAIICSKPDNEVTM